ncbi:hypothetical protein ANN_21976 [Periplaneta americana]|uniref:Uncharacterized protein n=1 Tax=Periplaneta americana TaxID=6978 RepID=A0ABQ8S7U1_PERAM|nr:hypothetical protein ANN_21976 [Periplaneta americana]
MSYRPYNIQKKTSTSEASKVRNIRYHYIMRVGFEEQVVCRSAFGSLHGIKPGRVKHVAMLTDKGEVPVNGRGKHVNRPHAYDLGMSKLIHDHIASYPVRKTHYSSRDVYYLSGALTISSMHRAFLKDKYPWCYEAIMKETISFDFMEHVPVPKIGVNEMFDLRHLWLYTFGIHQHSIEKPFFFWP